jgi:putative ABC transport system permease protein
VTPRPPLIGRWLLRARPLGRRRSDIEADLLELFERRLDTSSRAAASWRYAIDALSLWTHRLPDEFVVPAASRRRAGGHMRQDLVFAFRLFRRQPGIFGIAIVGLAVAIGLSTAIFGILRPSILPSDGVRDSNNVYRIAMPPGAGWTRTTGASRTEGNWAFSEFTALRSTATTLQVAAAATEAATIRSADGPTVPTYGRAVNGAYFETLGGTASLGRVLTAADDAPGRPPVVVLNHGYWTNALANDPGIVGRVIWLDEQPYTVVGVAARGFAGPTQGEIPPAFWIPLSSASDNWAAHQAHVEAAREAQQRALAGQSTLSEDEAATLASIRAALEQPAESWNPAVDVVGRLRPETTVDRATGEVRAIVNDLRPADAAPTRTTAPVSLTPIHAPQREAVVALSLVTGMLLLVVLLATANLTNVLLASASGRAREIATRLAIGATRPQIVRQLMIESLLLSGVASGAGFVLALWLTPWLARLQQLPPAYDVSPDLTAFCFVAAMAVAIGAMAGLAPARYLRPAGLLSALKTDRHGAPHSAGPSRLRTVLIAVQAAASVLLLVVAALFTRSMARTVLAPPGYQPSHLLNVSVGFPPGFSDSRTRAYWDVALARVRQAPGVEDAALTSSAPYEFQVASRTADGRYLHRVRTSASYFSTVGTRLVAGRGYSDDEVRAGAPVAVISESLARAYWADDNPLGASLNRVWGLGDSKVRPGSGLIGRFRDTRVIGVVADSLLTLNHYDAFTIFQPFDRSLAPQTARLLLRTQGDAGQAAGAVGQRLRAIDADPDLGVRTTVVSEYRDVALAWPVAEAALTSLIGVAALGLAVIGLFGMTAFIVNQRQHEVGVRMTLGARGEDILRMLLRDGLRPVVVGLGGGLLLAFLAGRLIQRALYGVTGHDPLAIGGAVAILLAAASTAILIPARRAARINPAEMLRE